MARALWSGAISFGLVHIPVQLFPADNSQALGLTMVDKNDLSPVGYKRINKRTGKEVAWEDIVKAYEYEHDQYVVLSDEDLRRANVDATHTIDILSFVDAGQIPPIHYEKPYYLTPAKGGDKVYALLREALKRSGKVAVAQIVIRTKQHLAAISPMGDIIVLDTLRYGDELRPADQFKLPSRTLKATGISDKELQMAVTLIEGMSEDWDPRRFHDTYREDVLALVEKKVQAHQTKTLTEPEEGAEGPPEAKIIDLMALLKQSLNKQGTKTADGKGAPRAPKKRASKSSSHRSKAG
jgi:DNA end-binding protein Ku